MKRILFATVAILFGGSLAAPAEFIPVGVVTYEAVGPIGKWKGTNKALQGKLTFDRASSALGGTICIVQKAWNSGEGIRDGHTREMFEVDKFPTACFVFDAIDGDVKNGKVALSGKLTMHGVTLPVKLAGTAKDDGTKLSFTGGFNTKITDWKMNRPSLLGFTVADEVPVTITAEASAP
jgi:polyisoprenoid-binding protein YceI